MASGGCVPHSSEAHLMPVLEAILHRLPFALLGFHTDNGSEYINYPVAGLMKELQVEFTKSRANRTQDNALPRLSQNQGHFLPERTVNIDPGTILRLDETIVKSGGESVEPPLSCVSPAAS